jgi:hypothetical protein
LNARLETLRREAALHRGFFQSQGSHFVVLFEGPSDEELVRSAVDLLKATCWRIGGALAVYPEGVLTVILYTQGKFRDITRSPLWAAGAYDGRIRVPVRGVRANPRELERVLAHEFTHALVQSVAPRGVPAWLSEGLTVLFEPTGDGWATEQLSSSARRLPLDRLAGASPTCPAPRRVWPTHRAPRRCVHWSDHGGAWAVVALLQDIAAGDNFETAFERRMFMAYESFATSLESRR